MFRILVVEDENVLADEIVWAIEGAGYSVVGPERSVDDALRTLDRFNVDLAVLNATLGRKEVFLFAAALAAKEIPLVMLSGHLASFVPTEYAEPSERDEAL